MNNEVEIQTQDHSVDEEDQNQEILSNEEK